MNETSSPTAARPRPRRVYDSAEVPHAFLSEWIELFHARDLVAQWSARNLKLRYKRTVLGILWTVVEPLMLMTILSIVFSTVFRFESLGHYPVYLLSGLLLWDFFRRSTLQIVEETIVSQGLAQRIHVPRSAFAVAAITSYLVHWLLALIPLVGIMLYFRHPFSWALWSLPLGIVLTALFSLGVGLIVATLGAFFYDVQLTYQVLLTAWLYATPIIYPASIIENPKILRILELNPILHFCEIVRSPVYLGTVAAPHHWVAAIGASFGTLIVGWWIFTHWRNAFDYRT